MSDAPFDPFDSRLDRDAALARLREATDGADDGELFVERRRSESVVFEDARVKSSSYDAAEGFGLRAVRGEVAGYAHSSDLSEGALARAVATARLAVGEGGGKIELPPSRTNARPYAGDDPIVGMGFAEKLDLLKEIDGFLRDLDPDVRQVTATLAASLQEVAILRPDGELYIDARPMARIGVGVILESGGQRESAQSGGGGRIGLEELATAENWQQHAREALRIAKVNFDAGDAPAGERDVVLGPGWPGILLHEAVGHGLEADFNRKGTSAFASLMGERVAAEGVTVVDDGTLAERRGSLAIDDEGTPAARTTLIEDGVLVGYMHDRMSARLTGAQPTGNGRRQSHAHAPMPRMTNTFMLGGESDPADILAGLDDGIYAVGFGGGQVDITNGKFVFSCTEAYRVRHGRVGAPIKGATIIGDGPTALRHIRAVGNDMALDPGIGNCGKSGQWVPVGVGQPTVLIGGLTVGGSAAE